MIKHKNKLVLFFVILAIAGKSSVQFGGMIREQQGAPANNFSEIWNLSKPVEGPGGWVLAGIQQLV